MRILLIPDKRNKYDLKQLLDLSQSFTKLGHETFVSERPLNCNEGLELKRHLRARLTIHVNSPAPLLDELQSGDVYYSWFQDYKPSAYTLLSGEEPRAVSLVMGGPALSAQAFARGVEPFDQAISVADLQDLRRKALSNQQYRERGMLVTAYIPPRMNFSVLPCNPLSEYTFAISCLVNRIPMMSENAFSRFLRGLLLLPESNSLPLPPPLQKMVQGLVSHFYEPLTGSLDSDIIFRLVNELGLSFGWAIADKDADFYSVDYPRYLDRRRLVEKFRKVGMPLNIYGSGWGGYSEYAMFSRGSSSREKLRDIYPRYKYYIFNNTHGIFTHSSSLEAMAAGCFVLFHSCTRSSANSPRLSEFTAGRHYIEYNSSTLGPSPEELNDNASMIDQSEVWDILEQRHTWDCRAKQILLRYAIDAC